MNAGPTDQELEPMPALLVVTSQKVYFLRITGSSTRYIQILLLILFLLLLKSRTLLMIVSNRKSG